MLPVLAALVSIVDEELEAVVLAVTAAAGGARPRRRDALLSVSRLSSERVSSTPGVSPGVPPGVPPPPPQGINDRRQMGQVACSCSQGVMQAGWKMCSHSNRDTVSPVTYNTYVNSQNCI